MKSDNDPQKMDVQYLLSSYGVLCDSDLWASRLGSQPGELWRPKAEWLLTDKFVVPEDPWATPWLLDAP